MDKKPSKLFYKKVAIVQSSYIPWKGYFDLVNSADEFILLDDVQYTQRDWRSRNCVKTAKGVEWLTIPIISKGCRFQKIIQARVMGDSWIEKHWKTIFYAYSKAPYFSYYFENIHDLYKNASGKTLSEINFMFIKWVCDVLEIKTKISWSTDYEAEGSKTERLVSLCKKSAATEYISGPSAKNYIKAELFSEANIVLSYFNYEDYLVYPQLHGDFTHYVSILDLLFNVGPEAARYMKSF